MHAARALEHQHSGRHAEAAAEWQAVRRLDPDNWEAAANHGTALAALGWHGQAEVAYREAIRLHPEGAVAWTLLGATLSARGMPG